MESTRTTVHRNASSTSSIRRGVDARYVGYYYPTPLPGSLGYKLLTTIIVISVPVLAASFVVLATVGSLVHWTASLGRDIGAALTRRR